MPLILTKAGLAALAIADTTGIKEQATHMAIGDANGSTPEFTEQSTTLVNEQWRGELQEIILKEDGQTVEFVCHVPITVGGHWIYEVAVYADGVLLAIGAHSPLFKPAPESPDKLELTIYAPVKIMNAGDILEITVDTTKVLASQEHVAEKIVEHDEDVSAHGDIAAGLGGHIVDKDAHGGPHEPLTTTGTISIGCGAMTPSATNGAILDRIEYANGFTRVAGFFAGADNDTSMDLEYPMPPDWNGGPVTAKLYWNAPDTAQPGDEIRFTLAALAVGDGGSPAAAFGAPVAITDTVITAGDDHESAYSTAMTVGGNPAAGGKVFFKLTRDFDYGAQSLADVAHGLVIRLKYNKA
jgi:phage-related tail fiber protein